MRTIGYFFNLSILIGFFLSSVFGSIIFADESDTLRAAPASTDMKMEFSNGKINAKLNQASLAKVLYKISSRQGFKIESRVDLSIYKITRKLADMSTIEFIKNLLESFDYTLIGNDSKIEKLIVLSASYSSKDQLFVNERAKEQSNSAGDYQAVSPSQATGKLPSFTPITNETGPNSDKPTLELPEFEPVENKTGPLVEDNE